jgi:hypothetical protein
MHAQDTKDNQIHSGGKIITSMFDLMSVMAQTGASDRESVATLAHLLDSHRVALCSPDEKGRRYFKVVAA